MGRNRLPHWHQDGGTVFVTFRLADSWPAELLREWETERRRWLKRLGEHTDPGLEAEYQRAYFRRLDAALDQGHGACALRSPAVAEVVASTLLHGEGTATDMYAFVVMPNHVHAVLGLRAGAALTEVVRSWKSYSSHVLKKRLGEAWPGWQRDYFDRLVRDAAHFARCVRYVRANPAKARLREEAYLLWESEAVRGGFRRRGRRRSGVRRVSFT